MPAGLPPFLHPVRRESGTPAPTTWREWRRKKQTVPIEIGVDDVLQSANR
jgi:hypothetical protein